MFTKRLNEEIKIKDILGKDDPVILECGANRGRTTKNILECFPQGKVFCFEPDPRSIAEFKIKHQHSTCKLIEAAVSDIDGVVAFNQSYRFREGNHIHCDSSTIKDTSNHRKLYGWLKYKNPILVKSVRLDTWRKENGIGNIDFIWADVEGAEEELIKGARETLAHTRYFYTEFSNIEAYNDEITLSEILRLLPDFVIVECWKYDVLLRNERIYKCPQ